ncbi:methyltransferase family protein [Ruegeria arenilitoris]|uniref:methyltransferase family protein n=1 Tax=Ruegeria arenilitoris TaxID=1173585 RepID=UPI00147CC6FA|nr:isoprenylcysteine carboxylmethyltransferase family protein [Ruegeria arenilitoris]
MNTAIQTENSTEHADGDARPASSTGSKTPPVSAVSEFTGLIGVVGLFAATLAAVYFDTSLLQSIQLLLAGAALPMIVSSILLDRAHLRASTGLDYGLRRHSSDVVSITVTKTLGLGATFFVIAMAYQIIPTYDSSKYELVRALTLAWFPIIWILSPAYIAFTTRHMVEPRDELWHFGKLITLQLSVVDSDKIKDHCRTWLVKGFFLAFMITILPQIVSFVTNADLESFFADPVSLILLLIQVSFLVDVCIGSIGYVCTFRVLDSHIRTANPYLSAWVAALVCYPPFALMTTGGPLDYRAGTQSWTDWLSDQPVLLIVWGGVILFLAIIYAWATAAFGLRFSNLTHRGIITTGPFRYSKHPAYLSKNIMWWMLYMPFLSAVGPEAALQSCILLLGVNALYYARAKTEEKHLMTDEDYHAYADWIAENGLIARLRNQRRSQKP